MTSPIKNAPAPERKRRGDKHGQSIAPSTPGDKLEAALSYASHGWHVLPLSEPTRDACSCGKECGSPGKHPRTRHGHNDASVDAETIRAWWTRWPSANVGIRTGGLSGIVVVDIDPRHGGDYALAELEDQCGPLPDTVESMTGGGGKHLLFQHPGEYVASRPDALGSGIDVRGDGGYIVAPPSIHPSGEAYHWELSSTPSNTPLSPLPQWLQLLCQQPASFYKNKETPPRHTQCLCVNPLIGGSVEEEAERVILHNLPRRQGERHHRLFGLARGLKGIPHLADREAGAVRAYVRTWHKLAKPVMRTKAWETTWRDFAEGWEKVKYPAGRRELAAAVQCARASDPPPEALFYTDLNARLLITVCRELQRNAANKPFPMACRIAAGITGLSHVREAKRLKQLRGDGLLVQMKEWCRRDGRRYARLYRYTGDTA